ncbi:MAG: hypothetical protein NT031_10035, partial [Planctomycetota bacterium]|nr:hypothetical protein [Planctomycetota bacterium]
TTMEDVEKMVQQSVPGGEVEFIPAGLAYAMKKARTFFRTNPRSEILLLAGVHPNCESMTLLVSDGKCFRSIGHYMKKPFSQAAVDFADRMKKIEPRLDKLDPKKFFQRLRGRWLIVRTILPWIFGTLRMGRLIGNPLTAIGRLLGKFLTKKVFRRRYAKDGTPLRRPRRIMRVAMLPFEEQHSIDAERLQNCKAVFAYEDVSDGSIRYFPACNWYAYRNPLLEKISQKYGIAGKETKEQIEAANQA